MLCYSIYGTTKLASYEYDAFGNQKSGTGAWYNSNPIRYCREYYDKESGLIYLRARYYDSEEGRFLSEDPAKDGYNWYIYCSGNPVNGWDSSGLEYGKLRDFVDDYYAAFGGNVSIQLCESSNGGFAYVTLGQYERAFYYDGTIIDREYDLETGDLIKETRTKIADNIDGTLYLQRSAFVAAMGNMIDDGVATVTVSETINVSRGCAVLNFASYINDAVSNGSDVKDLLELFGVSPVIGSSIRNSVALYGVYKNMSDGNVLASGNYQAERVAVQSPIYSWYAYKVDTLYGVENKTANYQWFIKSAYAWNWLPGGE